VTHNPTHESKDTYLCEYLVLKRMHVGTSCNAANTENALPSGYATTVALPGYDGKLRFSTTVERVNWYFLTRECLSTSLQLCSSCLNENFPRCSIGRDFSCNVYWLLIFSCRRRVNKNTVLYRCHARKWYQHLKCTIRPTTGSITPEILKHIHQTYFIFILGEEYKLWISSLCIFFQPPVTSFFFL
jgi:hypothetical protein